jgi:hypothetical protein
MTDYYYDRENAKRTNLPPKPWFDSPDDQIEKIDGHFDGRILNPNIEDDDLETDYNGTLASHVKPFLTALVICASFVAMTVILTPFPQLYALFPNAF